ncbi:MAG TPA: sugar phosphate isomerase/epimerase [Archaeoglobaceae archaeon]|nr:sugar phosphate isomerase/epimerase [Archaeoglobaceae archaeon]
MQLGFRVFHNRLWEVELCRRYGLAIEYRIDDDRFSEDGMSNAKILEDISLPVVFHYPSNGQSIWLSHSDEEERKTAVQKFQKYIDFCMQIRAQLIVIHDETPLGGLEPYVKSLEEVSSIAKNFGVKVCVENARLNPFDICEIIDNIPELHLAFDFGHANIQIGNKGIEKFFDRFWYKIEHLHIHDNHGIYDEHLIPGEGAIDYENITKKIKEINFEGFGIIELNWDIEPEYGIKRSIEFLRNLIQ